MAGGRQFDKAGELRAWAEAEAGAAKELHEGDKLYLADERLAGLRVCLDAHADGPLASEAGEAREWLEAEPFVAEVRERVEMSNRLLDEFLSDDGWELSREGGGRTTLYRSEEDTGTHSFKVRGEINAPLTHVAASLLEVDLFKHWFPMCNESEVVAHPSRYRKLARVVVSCPWPVANRETMVEGFGVEALERGMIVVNIRSVDEYPGVDVPGVADGCVRANISRGGFLIQPLSRTRCSFHMMINVDPQLPFLSHGILNWFTGKLVHVIVGCVESVATSFDPRASQLTEEELAERKKANKKFKGEDSPFVEAIRRDKDIYEYIEQQFEGHFARLDQEAADAKAEDA